MNIDWKVWNGVPMSSKRVADMSEQVLNDAVESLKDEDFCYVMSGDTMVIAFREGNSITMYQMNIKQSAQFYKRERVIHEWRSV